MAKRAIVGDEVLVHMKIEEVIETSLGIKYKAYPTRAKDFEQACSTITIFNDDIIENLSQTVTDMATDKTFNTTEGVK